MCAAAAAAAVAPFALSSFSGDTGTEITASLVDDAMAITIGSIVAVLVSAGLFLAAVRLGTVVERHVPAGSWPRPEPRWP